MIERPDDVPLPADVYLVRHGRTTMNAAGRFRGRQDPPLDERGLAEAMSAAEHLRDLSIGAVYSSPLRRSRQTADAIAALANLEVVVADRLVDIDYGSWEGLTGDEASARDPEAYDVFRNDPGEAIPPRGEPLADVADRVVGELIALALASDRLPIVAVSHEVPIRLALARATGILGGGLWEPPLRTGSIAAFDCMDERLDFRGMMWLGDERDA